jgi:trk system potassium uptake protein TrkA
VHIIIGGCGELGSQVAERLSEDPELDIVVIDMDERALDSLGTAFNGETFVGDITDRDVLERAGVDRADGLMAVTRSDNANLMAVQTAHHLYGVPRAVARLFNPTREQTYRKLGVRYVSATGILSKLFINEFRDSDFPHHVHHAVGEVELVDLWLGSAVEGMTVADVEVEGHVRVASITRGATVTVADGTDRLHAGDTVTVAMRRSQRRRVKRLLASDEERFLSDDGRR